MPNPVVHWELGTSDGGKLAGFYKEIFGWHTEEYPSDQGPYQMFDAHEERGINGGIAQSNQHPGVTFYVEVDDINAFLPKIEERGGKTLMPRTEMPMITMAMFADPDGHVLGLVEPRQGS
jgi:predicted enzyme related to lactoylglutathione lyase